MFCLFQKIKNTRLALIKWENVAFGNTKVSLKDNHRVLEELNSKNDPALLGRIRETKTKINNILHQEELAWRQRSRAIWLPVGDKNTKFFHQKAIQRKQRNQIVGVFNTEGEWCTDEAQIVDIAVEYFQSLFTSSQLEDDDFRRVLEAMDRRVIDEMNGTLLEPYTGEEVRGAFILDAPLKGVGAGWYVSFLFPKILEYSLI